MSKPKFYKQDVPVIEAVYCDNDWAAVMAWIESKNGEYFFTRTRVGNSITVVENQRHKKAEPGYYILYDPNKGFESGSDFFDVETKNVFEKKYVETKASKNVE